MTSFYDKLIGVDCSRYMLRKNFYLDLLKAGGIRTTRLTPTTVLNSSQDVLDDIQLLEQATGAEFDGIAAKVLSKWPTNIRVLISIGSSIKRGYPRTVFVLAARQLADKPTATMRKAIVGTQEDALLSIIGFDMLIDSYAHVEDYAAIVDVFDQTVKQGPLATVYVCLQILSALADHKSDDALQLFDYASQSLEMLPDPIMQGARQLACLAQHYHLRGPDAEFMAMLTNSTHLVDVLDDPMIQAHLHDYDVRIPGFSGAMRLQHTAREKAPSVAATNSAKTIHRIMTRQKFTSAEEAQAHLDSLLNKPLPEIPLHELTRDEYVEDLVEESAQLEDHERRMVLMGMANDYPDSMWPWLGLIDLSKSPQELLSYAEGGLLRGKRFEEAEYEHENAGDYWGIIETRPYIRLLINKALALQGLGKLEESITALNRILVLDTSDGAGARFMLPSVLIRTRVKHHITRAQSLLQENASDAGEAMHDWMQLLLHIINTRPSTVIDKAFNTAMASSIHIGYVLSGMPLAQFKRQFGTLSDTDEFRLREFIQIGIGAWDAFPEAMRKVGEMVEAFRR